MSDFHLFVNIPPISAPITPFLGLLESNRGLWRPPLFQICVFDMFFFRIRRSDVFHFPKNVIFFRFSIFSKISFFRKSHFGHFYFRVDFRSPNFFPTKCFFSTAVFFRFPKVSISAPPHSPSVKSVALAEAPPSGHFVAAALTPFSICNS